MFTTPILHSRSTALAALTLTLLLALGSARAQAPRPDPLDAKAASAPLVHRSALAAYRRLGDDAPPVAWRDANQTVERIGGWRAYAREAAAPPASAAAASAPPMHPHGGPR